MSDQTEFREETQAEGDLVTFNGLDPATGEYLVKPLKADQLRERVRKVKKVELFGSTDHYDLLAARDEAIQGSHYELPADADPTDLMETGWGVLFPAAAEEKHVDAILAALDELVQRRKGQAGGEKHKFKIFRRADGYQPGETGVQWAARHGVQPGVVDTFKIPYYLLIIGDPQTIPYHFQFELDAQLAVGRIYFEALDDYARYARSVVTAEAEGFSLPRQAAFFGVANEDDKPTQLSAKRLVRPLIKYVAEKSKSSAKVAGWGLDLYGPKESILIPPDEPPDPILAAMPDPGEASKDNLLRLLGGDKSPALLFTASHGLGWPYGDANQLPFQGALVCQGWPGPANPTPLTREMYLGAEDIVDAVNPLGMVVFCFACFGAGTPYWDDYATAQNKEQREALAHRAFLAALPRRLLSHPKGGALAVIGHVERAWGCSFNWKQAGAEPESFKSALYRLMVGQPVGHALEFINNRYAQIATQLSSWLDDLKWDANKDAKQTSYLWLANNDARGYIIIGDPAVKLSLAEAGVTQANRPSLADVTHRAGSLPVVLSLESVSEAERPAVEAEISAPPPEGAFSTTGAEAQTDQLAEANTPATPEKHIPPKQIKQTADQTGAPPASEVKPYASPFDRLAYAVQSYNSEEESFGFGDDVKKMVGPVVDNLFNALQNIAQKLQEAAANAATLEITTSVVEDLKTFDAKKPAADQASPRFKTTISLTGDIKLYLPSQSAEIDEVLLAMHRDMVEQAQTNRLEIVKALAQTIASLFG